MKALVTGAGGTVGKALCDYLIQNQHEVVAWDRQAAVPGDTQAGVRLFNQVQPDVIFHLALPSQPAGLPDEGTVVNEKWTADLASLAAQHGRPLVYSSTVMVYNPQKPGPYYPEDEPNETEGYGWGKLLGEKAAREAAPDHVRIARLGWQIGNEAGSNNMMDFLEKEHAEKGVISASTRWLPATSLLSATASALVYISGLPAGTYLVNSNQKWNFYQIVCALKRRHNRPWNVEASDKFVYDQRMLDPRVAITPLEAALPLDAAVDGS